VVTSVGLLLLQLTMMMMMMMMMMSAGAEVSYCIDERNHQVGHH